MVGILAGSPLIWLRNAPMRASREILVFGSGVMLGRELLAAPVPPGMHLSRAYPGTGGHPAAKKAGVSIKRAYPGTGGHHFA